MTTVPKKEGKDADVVIVGAGLSGLIAAREVLRAGRTPLVLFDTTRAAPSLLTPGDQVRFQRIDATAFERWLKKQ